MPKRLYVAAKNQGIIRLLKAAALWTWVEEVSRSQPQACLVWTVDFKGTTANGIRSLAATLSDGFFSHYDIEMRSIVQFGLLSTSSAHYESVINARKGNKLFNVKSELEFQFGFQPSKHHLIFRESCRFIF